MSLLYPLDSRCGVYAIFCSASNKVYVGISVGSISARIYNHFWRLKHNKHSNKYLQDSWNKYGSRCFEWHILELCKIDELNDRERFWISFLGTKAPDGFNLTLGGDGSWGWTPTEETKRKIGDAHKGKKRDPEVIRRVAEYHRGKKRSDEFKQKISEANRRRNLSNETKQKIASALRGKELSKEHKRAISDGGKQSWINADGRRRDQSNRSKKQWADPDRAEKMLNNLLNNVNKVAKSRRILTFEQAQEIRTLYASGNTSQAKLAKRYGVKRSLIREIVENKSYLD